VDRLIVDIDSGAADVSLWLEDEVPRYVDSVELIWPLAAEDGESLRWYVEDFLRAPFGVYEERGPRIEGSLRDWGERVFGALFGAGAVRDAFVGARARAVAAGRGLEVVFQSSEPGWLGLPWELMWQPGDPGPLVLNGVSVSRALPSGIAESFRAEAGDDRLRVLMVISRPEGVNDVGFQMVARPLLQRLGAVRGQVELTVLRPPTLDALKHTLQAAAATGRAFQVVHFDGHGVIPGRDYGAPNGGNSGSWAGPPVMFAGEPGLLVFEKPTGGADPVPSHVVGQVLAAGRVPLVVLNACQSGAVGKELEAAVATRLMQGGAASVVAMAYSVYAVAAAEFMAAFYERLFAGETVAEAVAAGRLQLVRRPLRPSPKGQLPLADWLVPVHYNRREVSFPTLQTQRPDDLPSFETALDRIGESTDTSSGELAPVGEFVGRDGLLYTLEVALRLQRVVILQGPGGTGKTELAKAFGRWWRDTGGVDDPGLVVWHSFEPGVSTFGLDSVITAIGVRAYGSDFARADDQERRKMVDQLLNEHRLLLIWDNFETVHSMPDPNVATSPLHNEAQNDLAEFVGQLAAGGRSALIITSKNREDWLGGTLRRVEVGGLVGDEITTYVDQLLAPYPDGPAKRQTKVFGELLEFLNGHPLSMRLILPYLERSSAQELLHALRGIMPLPGADDGGRLTSLPASITYSFTHIPTAAADALPALSLFRHVTDAEVLAITSIQGGCPDRFTGPLGETFDQARHRWTEILDIATSVGVLTNIGAGIYRIHPALPGYLTAQWRKTADDYPAERSATEHAVLVAFADFTAWAQRQIDTGNAAHAFALIDQHRANLNDNLRLALQLRNYELAQPILGALDQIWLARGLNAEADAWVDIVRDRVETPEGEPPTFDTKAGELWLEIVIGQAHRQAEAGLLDQAEFTYQKLLTSLNSQPETLDTRPLMATALQELGLVFNRQRRFEEAEDCLHKSLSILEELGNWPGIAYNYHGRGIIAQDRAIAAQDQSQLEEAEDWFRRSLTIREDLGDRPGSASTYHQLGIVAHLRRRLDDAEDWYLKSLTIVAELGDRPGIAASCHQLGSLAQDRGRLQEAKDWYLKALTIREELGDRPGTAMTYGQLGLLAEEEDKFDEALEWTLRCIALFPEFPSPSTGPAPHHLRRLTNILGIEALEQAWTKATKTNLPADVRAWAEAND
jgi:tetratricopeptide (TPR) repeat protein